MTIGTPPAHAGADATRQPACGTFDMDLHEGEILYAQLLPAEGSPGRMALYQNNIRALPLPPALWHAFQRACREDASSQQLGKIIKDDPVLSAAILRSANSAGLGALIPINDVGRAISRLGHSMVRGVVASHSFASGNANPCKIYDIQMLWKHGMAVSALAEIIAAHIPGCNPDEAGTLGLFHDIGSMGFNLINEFAQPAELDPARGHLVYEFSRFGCTHIDMGLLLARHWQLPEKITRGISYHHHPGYAEAESIPADIRAEVLAVFLADMLAIRLGCAAGNPGGILPHASFAAMLPDTTLQEIANSKKVRAEMAAVQAIEF